jgi:hypothetical protein
VVASAAMFDAACTLYSYDVAGGPPVPKLLLGFGALTLVWLVLAIRGRDKAKSAIEARRGIVVAAGATVVLGMMAAYVYWDDGEDHRKVQAAVQRGEVRIAEGMAAKVWHRKRVEQFVVADLPFHVSANASVGFAGGGGVIQADRPVRLHYVVLPLPTIIRVEVPQGDPRCHFAL